MTQAQWSALGTTVVLRVTDPAALAGARSIVEGQLAHVDRACSRFRNDSDLSRVNAHPGRMVAVDGLLIEALHVALRAARVTDGDVDPTLGWALDLAGYDRDWNLLDRCTDAGTQSGAPARHSSELVVHARRRSGWQNIDIDSAGARVRVAPGVRIDLGATAKAWAADRCARAVCQRTGSGVLVGLGGDIATAGQAPAHGWRVHVTDDHRATEHAPGQTVAIRSGGLATSSTTVRRWRQDGADRHHIIDPATGVPADGPWRTVSVAAASCTDANIATTAALVRGTAALPWLTELGLPARLVDQQGGVRVVGDWPAKSVHAGIAVASAPAADARRRETGDAQSSAAETVAA